MGEVFALVGEEGHSLFGGYVKVFGHEDEKKLQERGGLMGVFFVVDLRQVDFS